MNLLKHCFRLKLRYSYRFKNHTLSVWDNLKNEDSTDIWIEVGDFQPGIFSTVSHFLSSTKEAKESLSLDPLYCLNSPFITWNIVGSAVTINRPLKPGDFVTSTWATLIPKAFDQVAKSLQVDCNDLHAGHHGA